ncbi:MAG: hypothetical protein HETSPECPRED_002350 [Heterodermia speciosa]|uniref:Uncharacterized protein n=1 Tax=Heterodermia speciosa TaxID=116794 RepID=A0A8H3EZ46_9LECA|nr:MAG: hypothetical protein HETSPECPRED_002350 [Heterodermia speciosa]
MPSVLSRAKKNGTLNWHFGRYGHRNRDRKHRRAIKTTARSTVIPVPVLFEAEIPEAQGLSPALPKEHSFDLAQSDFGNAPHQARSKVTSTAASTVTLHTAVQPSNEKQTNADDVQPHNEIKLGRIFLGFVRKNKDLVKAYNSRLPYVELDLSQKFLRFTSENQDLIQACISRVPDQAPTNTLRFPSNAVPTSPRPSSDSYQTCPVSATSSDEADNAADNAADPPQPTISLNALTRSQYMKHIAAAMKATGYSKEELFASYGRGEVPIGGQWAQRE